MVRSNLLIAFGGIFCLGIILAIVIAFVINRKR